MVRAQDTGDQDQHVICDLSRGAETQALRACIKLRAFRAYLSKCDMHHMVGVLCKRPIRGESKVE